MNKNTQFDGYEWISTHNKAIAMVAAFSGLEFDAVAVSLYDRKHAIRNDDESGEKPGQDMRNAA